MAEIVLGPEGDPAPGTFVEGPNVVPLEMVPFPMLVADDRGRVLAVNSRWTEFSGLSREDSLGVGWHGVLDHAAPLEDLVARVAAGQVGHGDACEWTAVGGRRAQWWVGSEVRAGERLVGLAVGRIETDEEMVQAEMESPASLFERHRRAAYTDEEAEPTPESSAFAAHVLGDPPAPNAGDAPDVEVGDAALTGADPARFVDAAPLFDTAPIVDAAPPDGSVSPDDPAPPADGPASTCVTTGPEPAADPDPVTPPLGDPVIRELPALIRSFDSLLVALDQVLEHWLADVAPVGI
ncbi:MAG TPA: PAS domain-containing protein [Acidimicrobiales bacterium]|nr:PAS domain-containing protein [Acidimicrobiales bacterium]